MVERGVDEALAEQLGANSLPHPVDVARALRHRGGGVARRQPRLDHPPQVTAEGGHHLLGDQGAHHVGRLADRDAAAGVAAGDECRLQGKAHALDKALHLHGGRKDVSLERTPAPVATDAVEEIVLVLLEQALQHAARQQRRIVECL